MPLAAVHRRREGGAGTHEVFLDAPGTIPAVDSFQSLLLVFGVKCMEQETATGDPGRA